MCCNNNKRVWLGTAGIDEIVTLTVTYVYNHPIIIVYGWILSHNVTVCVCMCTFRIEIGLNWSMGIGRKDVKYSMNIWIAFAYQISFLSPITLTYWDYKIQKKTTNVRLRTWITIHTYRCVYYYARRRPTFAITSLHSLLWNVSMWLWMMFPITWHSEWSNCEVLHVKLAYGLALQSLPIAKHFDGFCESKQKFVCEKDLVSFSLMFPCWNRLFHLKVKKFVSKYFKFTAIKAMLLPKKSWFHYLQTFSFFMFHTFFLCARFFLIFYYWHNFVGGNERSEGGGKAKTRHQNAAGNVHKKPSRKKEKGKCCNKTIHIFLQFMSPFLVIVVDFVDFNVWH